MKSATTLQGNTFGPSKRKRAEIASSEEAAAPKITREGSDAVGVDNRSSDIRVKKLQF